MRRHRIAVPSLDQLGFQLFHESRDRHVERDAAGGLQGNAQVFVKAQLEAKRIAPLEHGPTAMVEGPGARGARSQGLDHLLHRQFQPLSQSHCLRDGGVAAGHQHLVHRLACWPLPTGPMRRIEPPITSSSGRTVSKTAASPPTSTVRVPARPSAPPVTGASR